MNKKNSRKNHYLDIYEIGEKIRLERLKRKIKQNVLAKQAGISNTYLSDIEHQRTLPSLTTYIRLCEALNIDFGYILNQNN
ncbi:MAG: helix-turn-helix domain-containing protein [Clostridia bacterium]|nr:helix-turn-helix domain-containing protein [Clostridia bacterium]